jgi:heme/copper-type cytochrome/quinol oxidase subunit 2
VSDPTVPSSGGHPPQDPQGHPQQDYSAQGQPQQGYPQQGQPQQGYQPGQPPYGGQPAEDPGKTLGIVGLVLSFFTAIIGLIISIVALRKSKKAGFKNTPALIGIIVGILSTIVAIIIAAVSIIAVTAVLSQCAQLGPGQHEVNGTTITCS